MPTPARSTSPAWKWLAVFVAGALVGALSAIQVVPAEQLTAGAGVGGPTDNPVAAGQGNSSTADGTATTGETGSSTTSAGTTTGTGSNSTATSTGGGGLQCAPGKNGGETDRGVTGSEIRLATTVVDSGIGAAFLRDVRFAMEAVRIKINNEGGVCGRRLNIRYIDDGWDAAKGAQFLRNLILEPDPDKQIFAIPVGPSSEGLRVVINSGDIDKTETPVVGADGLLIDQYLNASGRPQPWVWPVAAATVSSARIMVRRAFGQGATEASHYSVVFDKNYRFGQEGAQAFNAEVKRLTGENVPGFNTQGNCQQQYCGVQAGQSSYSTQVETFREGKVVALFLEPQTALTWMNDPNTPAANFGGIPYGYAGAMPLFTRDFAVNCQAKCDQMNVWTSFKPFIESYRNDAAVREYVNDLRRANPQADEFNQFAEGGYVGVLLLVEALEKVGPNLTRHGLKAALDNMCINPGLTIQDKLCWSSSTRFASTTMQSFQIQYKGTFSGWRAGPIVEDPRPQAGIGN